MQKFKTIFSIFLILFTSMSLAMLLSDQEMSPEELKSQDQYENLTYEQYKYMTPEQQSKTYSALMDELERGMLSNDNEQLIELLTRRGDLNAPPRKFTKAPPKKSCLEEYCCCPLQ